MTPEAKAEKLKVLAAIINKAVSFQHVIQHPPKLLKKQNDTVNIIPKMKS